MQTIDVARDRALELVTLAAVMVELRKLLGDDLTTVGDIKNAANERERVSANYPGYRAPREHIVEDRRRCWPTRAGSAPRRIVSKKIDGTYRSGPSRAWIKVHNPASIAVQRERSERWDR